MSITIKIDTKSKAVLVKIDEGVKFVKNGIRQALHKIGVENRRHARKLIRSKEKTGRLYLIHGKVHRASAPGESPANLTGQLAKSIGFKANGAYSMEFFAKADYAGYLEDGTSKMARRPFMERTVKDKERDAERYLMEAVDREIKS